MNLNFYAFSELCFQHFIFSGCIFASQAKMQVRCQQILPNIEKDLFPECGKKYKLYICVSLFLENVLYSRFN